MSKRTVHDLVACDLTVRDKMRKPRTKAPTSRQIKSAKAAGARSIERDGIRVTFGAGDDPARDLKDLI